MDSARFRRIEELYHSALEREPEQRDSFLEQACGNDAELRREVKALLAKEVSTGALVDRSAWAGAGELDRSALRPGDALGPYEIAEMLGAGGMGEVYRARDTRLGRQVAIKVCRERFSDRFEREARTISALNHLNICTVYDVGPKYLVMELVEGETLRDWLKRAPGKLANTPRDRKMEIATQVLQALRAAHSAGALAIDPTLPEANLAKAFILWSPAKNFQHAEAIAALEKVLEARPNLEQAHNRMASICHHIGRFEEARMAYEHAQRANPKNIQIPVRQLALENLWNGNFARAEGAGETWMRESPGDPQALWFYPQPPLMIGSIDVAARRLVSALKLRPNDPLLISLQGMLQARRGEARSAIECAHRTLGFPQTNGHFHHAYYQVACIYAVLGETENAMGWLTRSADTGFPCWPFFKVDPHLEKLREKPAFKKLVSDLERKWTALKIERL